MQTRSNAGTPVRRHLAVLILGACLSAPTALAQSPQSAPLNPEFVRYVTALQSGPGPAAAAAEPHYGLVPLPMDLSSLRTQASSQASPAGVQLYPAAYDLRGLGRVTPVRDQAPYGTCWAFGAYGSFESCLLPAETWHFSEDNLVNRSGFDWAFDAGGNATMAMAYFARWAGPVDACDDPYAQPGASPAGLAVRKHVQQVRLIPPKAGATLNDELKQVLLNFGAIDVTYCHLDAYYSPTYHTYNFVGSSAPNHSVTLVGWDDNFDRSKFVFRPAGSGAYIVKNSWGPSWGENGYFYVSYYDARFGTEPMFAFLNAEPTNNYARQYGYDCLGWINQFGMGGPTLWAANVFTAVANETLSAVSFYAQTPNTSYSIEVHTGVAANAPRSGRLASTQTGECSYPGYRTISLDAPAPLQAGQSFSIVLSLTTPGNNFPQPYECALSGYSSAAAAAPGQSYYSGSGSNWTDLTTYDPSANFCIKGFTTLPAPRLTLTRNGGTIALTWPSGVLQQADSVQGPFTEVTGATSPYSVAATGLQKFYRLR